jgi:hypothetical protein
VFLDALDPDHVGDRAGEYQDGDPVVDPQAEDVVGVIDAE